jgi:hypothetical protein
MGWRERDYAKFTREEWKAYLGSDRAPRSGGPARPRQAKSRARGVLLGLFVGSLLFAGFTGRNELGAVAAHAEHAVRTLRHKTSTEPAGLRANVVAPAAPRVDKKLIRIRWRHRDVAPAIHAGRICVRDSRHGTICASYVFRERPADALTRRLKTLGLHVQSAG